MPRKRHHSSSAAPVALILSSHGSRKCKTWLKECKEAAIKAVYEGQTNSGAAHDHGVLKSVLFDRISGKVNHGTNPGPRPYLDHEEEKELSLYLNHCAKVGYEKTRRYVLFIVQTAVYDKEAKNSQYLACEQIRLTFISLNRFLKLLLYSFCSYYRTPLNDFSKNLPTKNYQIL